MTIRALALQEGHAPRPRPKILDLFCGAGGAAMGYHRAGFDVCGVDIHRQPRFPFVFLQEDALAVLAGLIRKGNIGFFSAIHASPPCQRYSAASKRWNGAAERHPDLVAPTRELLIASGLPYVIENVVGAPLIDPIQLCGSAFPLGVQRHRLFESNVELEGVACDHASMPLKYDIYDHGRWYKSRVAHVFGHGGGKSKGDWPEAMGIDWMTNAEMAQAIPPAYTEHIGKQLIEHINQQHEKRAA